MRLSFILFSLLLSPALLAQTPDTSAVIRAAAVLPDTLRLDSLPAIRPDVRVGTSTLTPVADSLGRRLRDTLRVSSARDAAIRKIVPRQATLRSLMFPGLGQIYNRQYWKLPFVYGGFATLGYFIVRFTNAYQEYRDGYITAYYATGSKVAVVRGRELEVQQLKQAADTYKRWRDGDYILAVLLYGLTAVEANVAAHLKTFDLSDDISLKVRPAALPPMAFGGLPIPGVRLTFHLK
jgi:hypothetical protein